MFLAIAYLQRGSVGRLGSDTTSRHTNFLVAFQFAGIGFAIDFSATTFARRWRHFLFCKRKLIIAVIEKNTAMSSSQSSISFPPTSPIARNIGTDHWREGFKKFNGKDRLTISSVKSSRDVWTYSIELTERGPCCITRFNNKIVKISDVVVV